MKTLKVKHLMEGPDSAARDQLPSADEQSRTSAPECAEISLCDTTHASAEETPLLDAASQSSGASSSVVAPLEGDSPVVRSPLDEEMDHPWPATFERSISLLAGPRLDVKKVDVITKSPKIGMTPIGFRKPLRSLQRGFMTPDPERAQVMPSSGTQSFKKGIAKIQSLDLGPSSTSSAQISSKVQEQSVEQGRRALEAHAYRQKILKKQGQKQQPYPPSKDEEDGLFSPGYHRERKSERQKMTKTDEKVEAKATFSQCCFNMANILMGVGLLGLPFVLRSAGWIGGFFVTVTFAFVTWRTSILIGRELNGDPRPGHFFDDSPFKSPLVPGSSPAARMRQPIKSFPDIARDAFGDKGSMFLSSVLYFELFSCLCIFFVTLGDHLHSLFPSISMTDFMMIVAIALTVPTALLRTPRLLSYLSMVGTFATIAVVISVLLSAMFAGDISETVAEERGIADAGPYHVLWQTSGLPLALGLIAYSFSGHAIVPSIYSSMARPQEFERMIHVTFLVVTFCCLLVAMSGYFMFGSVVKDQITISLAETSTGADTAMKMLTWLMILTAFSKFTLTMFPLALGIEEIVAPYVSKDKIMEATSSLIKLILIVMSLSVAIFCPSFSFLCSLVGLICTMIVSVIFPAAAHLKLFGSKLTIFEKVLDWTLVVIGTVTAIVGTVATLK